VKDFNGNEIKVGSIIFTKYRPSKPMIGRVTKIDSKIYIYIDKQDIIKIYDDINSFNANGFQFKGKECIVLNDMKKE